MSSFLFRLLNSHFPNAGASYHWSARVIGKTASRYQAWILILAYFLSIPPIALPAGAYTLALIAPHYHATAAATMAVALFWIAFASVPLLLGAKPTARITQVFFCIEMAALAGFAVLGVMNWQRLAVPIHFGKPPVGGILIVAVLAATILDGWEIDSYAAEESRRPRDHPGVGGIIGAFGALLFYAVLYPLLLGETPMHLLAGSTDPLAVWSRRLIPGEAWAMLLPVLLSTAGGLWLTTFILTRALYAMGREQLIPSAFAKLSGQHVPHIATLTVLGLAAVVVSLQLLITSLGSLFEVVLSGAGFFLLVEFFLDSVTATVFLTTGHRRVSHAEVRPHSHRLLTAGAILSSLLMGALLVAFLIYGPKAIGGGVDQVFMILLGMGVAFVWWTGRRSPASGRLAADVVSKPLTGEEPRVNRVR
jgi:amino acid transporter